MAPNHVWPMSQAVLVLLGDEAERAGWHAVGQVCGVAAGRIDFALEDRDSFRGQLPDLNLAELVGIGQLFLGQDQEPTPVVVA
jgi:hypothetical protein